MQISGVNFMHLNPEITKFLLGVAREERALAAVERLDEAMEIVTTTFPILTQEQAQQQLIQSIKTINTLAK